MEKRALELVALPGCVHEWSQLPFNVCLGLFQSPLSNFVGPHLEPRADLGKLHLSMRRFDKYMMPGRNESAMRTGSAIRAKGGVEDDLGRNLPEANEVALIPERHDSFRILFRHRE